MFTFLSFSISEGQLCKPAFVWNKKLSDRV